MRRWARVAALLVAAWNAAAAQTAAAQSAAGPAVEDGLNGTQRDEVLEMIESYLLNNPEVLARALARFGERGGGEPDGNIERLLAQAPRAAKLALGDPNRGGVVVAAPEGRVTLTIAFDYACPFCRTVAPRLERFMQRHPEVRVLFREAPILSTNSHLAARVGLAVARQGTERYLGYHFALMARRGPLSEQAILDAAAGAGADLARLAADAADPAIDQAIAANRDLLRGVGVLATPMVAVGERIATGALQPADFELLLREAAP